MATINAYDALTSDRLAVTFLAQTGTNSSQVDVARDYFKILARYGCAPTLWHYVILEGQS